MRVGVDARPLISEQPSGIGIYTRKLLQYLSSSFPEHEFFLYSNEPLFADAAFPENVRERILPGRVGTLWLREQVPKHLKEDGIRLFWGTQHILPKKVPGIRFVLTVHDLSLLINPGWGSHANALMQNVFTRRSVREADRIIAISQSTKNDIVRLLKKDPALISVIYIGGIDAEEWKPLQNAERKESRGEAPYFCYIGTIEPRKNIDLLIRAFELAADSDPEIRLVLAGNFGWKYEGTRQRICASRHKERILLPGYVTKEKKTELLRNARAFVFPSFYEGFGIPVQEAQALGCPVITCENSSLPEVGGEAAIYVKEDDPELLARKMADVRNMSAEQRQALIRNGYRQAEKFSWETCGKETAGILFGPAEE